MLTRLILPEICFSGRLGRTAFWREIAVSIFWTPVVVAALGFLIKEAANVTPGIAGSGLSLGALAGIVVFALGARNMVAMLGVIKRRMNDRGYDRTRIMKFTWPLITVLMLFPAALVVPPALAVAPILMVVQFFLFIRAASDLVVGPSYDTPDVYEYETADSNEAFQLALRQEFDKLGPRWAGAVGMLSGGIDNIRDRLNEAYEAREKLAQASRNDRIDDMISRHKRSRTGLPPARPEAHSSKVVQATGIRPRTGRTTILSGIISGPWG